MESEHKSYTINSSVRQKADFPPKITQIQSAGERRELRWKRGQDLVVAT